MTRLRRRLFLLTGFTSERKQDLIKKIRKLGAIHGDAQSFQVTCTHIVCNQPSRSEKFLAGLATGKWMVTPAYVDYSHVAGRWLEEEPYEWDQSKKHLVQNPQIHQYLDAPSKWRKWVQETSLGAFVGWRAVVLVENAARKVVYRSLLQFGSAQLVNIRMPIDPEAIADTITHIFVEDNLVHQVAPLSKLGVLCLQPLYIGAYLLQDPPPDPAMYCAGAGAPSLSKSSQLVTSSGDAAEQNINTSMAIDASLLATPTTSSAPKDATPLPGRSVAKAGDHVASPVNLASPSCSTPILPSRQHAGDASSNIKRTPNIQKTPSQKNSTPATPRHRKVTTPRNQNSSLGVTSKDTPGKFKQQGLQKWLVRTPKSSAPQTGRDDGRETLNVDPQHPCIGIRKIVKTEATEESQSAPGVVIDLTEVDENANERERTVTPAASTGVSNMTTRKSRRSRVAPDKFSPSKESSQCFVSKTAHGSRQSLQISAKSTPAVSGTDDQLLKSKRIRQAPDRFTPTKDVPEFPKSLSSTLLYGSKSDRCSTDQISPKTPEDCSPSKLNINLCIDKAVVRNLAKNANILTAARHSTRPRTPPVRYSPSREEQISQIKTGEPCEYNSDQQTQADVDKKKPSSSQEQLVAVASNRSKRKRNAPDKFSPSVYERRLSCEIPENSKEEVVQTSFVIPRVFSRRVSVELTPLEDEIKHSPDPESPLSGSDFIVSQNADRLSFTLTPKKAELGPSSFTSDQESPCVKRKTLVRSTQSVSLLNPTANDTSHDASPKVDPPSFVPPSLKRKLSVDLPDSSCKRARYDLNDAIPVTRDAFMFDLEISHGLKPCLPLSDGHVCISNFEACMEENRKMFALDVLFSFISTKCCPPPRTLNTVIVEILLESTDMDLSQKAYNLLGRILERHPPLSSARQLTYLHALQPGGSEGVSGAAWTFLHSVISGVLVNRCIEEDEEEFDSSTDSDTKSSVSDLHAHNSWLCLQFLVALLEVDFRHTVMRCGQANKSLILAVISNVKHHRELISSLMAAAHAKSLPGQKMEIVQHLQSLVAMVAEACHQLHAKSRSPVALNLPATSYSFANEFAFFIKADVEDDMESLRLLVELSHPRWLTMLISSVLLGELFDDVLVPDITTSRGAPLTMHQILRRYFFLLPPVKNLMPTTPLQSPHVRGSLTRPSKRTPKSVDASPLPSPQKQGRNTMTKQRIASINKRNIRGETALHTACIKNNIARVQQLLAVPGINVNMKDNAGWTPLHEACNHGHLDIVKLLLDYSPPKTIDSYFLKDVTQKSSSVDLLAANDDGITPLHDAVENNHIDVTLLLIQRGGRNALGARTVDGKRPIDVALTEEMRMVLSEPYGLENRVPLSQSSAGSQGSCSQDSMDGSIPVPDESQYEVALGPQGFVSAINIQKYLFLLLQTLTSYVTVHGPEAVHRELKDFSTSQSLRKHIKLLEAHLYRIAEPESAETWHAKLETMYILAEAIKLS